MIFVFCDGASKGNPGPSSIGVSGVRDIDAVQEVFTLSEQIGVTTNNKAEWTSLVKALEECLRRQELNVHIYMDSELVVKQVTGIYKVRDLDLQYFSNIVKELKPKFQKFSISHVRREKNKRADELANLAFAK